MPVLICIEHPTAIHWFPFHITARYARHNKTQIEFLIRSTSHPLRKYVHVSVVVVVIIRFSHFALVFTYNFSPVRIIQTIGIHAFVVLEYVTANNPNNRKKYINVYGTTGTDNLCKGNIGLGWAVKRKRFITKMHCKCSRNLGVNRYTYNKYIQHRGIL